ncbi:MAG: HEAT repeat domain-containing protein [Anaerolineae bacterium]|nr:HEAT repeat domain-containing protein [Anaerolineae bacterium]
MAETHLLRVQRILQKLEQVRKRKLTCFGSQSHNFRLKSPISEYNLRAFETEHSIQLPDDYRTFLLHAGNGGAGPFYGLYPLDKWDDFADWVLEEERPDNFLALPCPLTPELEPSDDWVDQFTDCVSPYQGTISLGTQGCTYATQLIVSGPYAGRVVYVEASDLPPYIVYEADFLAWYERWLDELLQGYKTHWFGFGPGGGEEDFFRILDDPQAKDDFKAEAIYAFCHLPQLSNEASRRIPTFLGSTIDGVRAGALATISKFMIRGATDKAVRLLDDPSPEVRKQAVRTVMELDPVHQGEAVLRRLHEDPDEEVAKIAFIQLESEGTLHKPMLLQLIKNSPVGGVRYLAAHAVTWADEDIPLLSRMLSDSNVQVRFCATLGVRQLKARSALPHVLELLEREEDPNVVGSILKMLGEFADPSTVSVLLKWAADEDDFHSLDAIEALAMIGDERALPIIRAMLTDNHRPSRWDADGLGGMSSSFTVNELVRKSLKQSPNPTFRKLV